MQTVIQLTQEEYDKLIFTQNKLKKSIKDIIESENFSNIHIGYGDKFFMEVCTESECVKTIAEKLTQSEYEREKLKKELSKTAWELHQHQVLLNEEKKKNKKWWKRK